MRRFQPRRCRFKADASPRGRFRHKESARFRLRFDAAARYWLAAIAARKAPAITPYGLDFAFMPMIRIYHDFGVAADDAFAFSYSMGLYPAGAPPNGGLHARRDFGHRRRAAH